MEKQRRKWSSEQKLQIIQEVSGQGLVETLRKYNLSQSLFHKWKRSFKEQGLQGLQDKYPRVDPQNRMLENEVKQLRQLVGKLSLELEFKNELLKKKS